jgi:hypothetical protein
MVRRVSFAVLLMVLAGSPALGQEWARKMFPQTTHDFGSVARGAKAEHKFTLSNLYLEDVHVASVRSSCGCTSPRINNPSLKTYQKGAIVAKFNTHKFLGRNGATVTVTFDKPFPAQVQLHVKGYIRSDVVFNPSSVQMGAVDRGSPADMNVAVDYAGRNTWKILEVKSSNPHVSGKVVETRRWGGRVRYGLTVRLDDTAPLGEFNEHLLLITDDRQMTQIPIQVEGEVVSAVTVSPASLFMGVVRPGQRVTKQLVVRGKKAFKILSVTCDDESFEFGTFDRETARKLHVIPVTFVAGEGTGKISETIRVRTDLGEMSPELAAYAVIWKE